MELTPSHSWRGALGTAGFVTGGTRCPAQGCHIEPRGQSCPRHPHCCPHPSPRVLLGLWVSGRTNQQRTRCSGEDGGTPGDAGLRSGPPTPSLCPPAMRSATSTTPLSSSTISTPPRAKASSTAGLTSWATSSRYGGQGHMGHRCPQEPARLVITISLSPGGSPDSL